MRSPRRELLATVLAGLAAFGVYLRTMYPGLVGSGDTPELQFAGRVLGTAHTPGYPLYILLSHAFSRLPVGTLAFRGNLFSVVCAALAVALAVVVLRRLGCRPVAAVATALALGFGRTFWSQATLAEVYALAAALLLGLLAAVLDWGVTRRDAALLAAFAFAALSLGHHYTDVVTVAPALALYVLLTDARAALRPKLLAVGAMLLALGVTQYGFILLRTAQHAPYLGSQASTFGELLDVMRGGRFGSRLFAFDLRTLVVERVPTLARLGLEEMGLAGLALLALGLAVLLRRDPRAALLFVLGAAGPAFFAWNYDVPDVAVFLIPCFLLLWPVVGVGLEALLAVLEARLPRAAMTGLALLLPALQLGANYRASDHHTRSFEMRYFRALVESLPARSAVLSESYTVDQMLRYELLGEGFGASRDIVLSPRDPDSVEAYRRKGYALFAFERGRQELAPLGFGFAPVTLRDVPLPDALRVLPPGTTVLVAGPASPEISAALAVLAGSSAGGSLSGGRCAAVGVLGEAGVQVRCDPESAELELKAGQALGGSGKTAPAALRAESRLWGAIAEVNGRVAARADDGLAVAAVSPAGRVIERYELEAGGDGRVPFNRRAFPLFRIIGAPACVALGNLGFVDVATVTAGGRVLGRIDNYRPFDASLVLYLGRDRPLAPRLVETQGRGTPRLEVRTFGPTGGRPGGATQGALDEDGLGHGHALAVARVLQRVVVRVNDEGEFSAFTLDLGGVPSQAWARAQVDLDNPKRAQLCALPAAGRVLFAEPMETAARIAAGSEGAAFFGSGWHPPERDGPLEFRWTSDAEADLLIPLARAQSLRLQLWAMPPAEAGPAAMLDLRVNGQATEARTLAPGWRSYEWTLPAATWRVGVNDVRLHASFVRRPPADGSARDTRSLGVAIGPLRLQLLGGP